MLFWAEGLWTAEPDTVPRPGELRCSPQAACSAAGRMRTAGRIFPFRTPWRRGLPGAVSNEYDDAALLSGTDLFRSGEGFLCAALESGLHRICVAAGQAVSGVMWLMRRTLERRKAEPVRSSGREGSEALAGDTSGNG